MNSKNRHNRRRWRAIRRLRPYRGAGVLFYRMESGKIEVLLGKRCYRPYAGRWSVPGGRCERSHRDGRMETSWETALRETEEEIGVRFQLDGSAQEPLRTRLGVPGIFSFTTFILPYPVKASMHCGHEFSSLEWFPLHELPIPLHHGVMRAVRKLSR